MPPSLPSHRRVLVVDDDARARDAVALLLEAEGYDASVAGDGEEATGLVASWRPDLVLTDLQMPKLDGRGLLERLRREAPGTPVIVLSAGVGTASGAVEGLDAAGFFTKPVRIDALLALIRELLGG
jgi:DNA-binding response OmpR family regulator